MPYGSPSTPRVRSISRRFSHALIGVVPLRLVEFASFTIFIYVSKTQGELGEILDNSLKLVEISLPIPLLNIDHDVVDDFVKSLLLDKSVVYAKVLWGNLVITEKSTINFNKTPGFFVRSSKKDENSRLPASTSHSISPT